MGDLEKLRELAEAAKTVLDSDVAEKDEKLYRAVKATAIQVSRAIDRTRRT